MRADVKEQLADNGSSITILSADELSVTDDSKLVGIQTNNGAGYDDGDELWIFKRKAFLRAVSKALDVNIIDADPPLTVSGYYPVPHK